MGFKLILIIILLIIHVGKVFSKENQAESANESITLEKERTIESNMFPLQYGKVLQIEISKWGGGIDVTNTELILVTGGGQTRVVSLPTLTIYTPEIALPDYNERDAINAASRLTPLRAKMAVELIEETHRYDDILVFDHRDTRLLVLSYSHFDPSQECFTHRVSVTESPRTERLSALKVKSQHWRTIYRSHPCFSFKLGNQLYAGDEAGGRMAVVNAEKGDILLTLGDYGFNGVIGTNFAQSQHADYGKILRINVFSGKKEVLSIGHRNPQGITVDHVGRIWSVEHGPQGGDELNLIYPGSNYGWPHVTFGINYGSSPWPLNKNQGRHDGFYPPHFAWVPSIAVSNIDQSINFHPFWEGDLLVYSLKGMSINRIRLNGDRILFSESIPFFERIRYGLNHPETGKMYLWTDDGALYQLAPAPSAWKLVERSQDMFESHSPAETDGVRPVP